MDKEAFAKFDKDYVIEMEKLNKTWDLKEMPAHLVLANVVFWNSILIHNLPMLSGIAAALTKAMPNLCSAPKEGLERGH